MIDTKAIRCGVVRLALSGALSKHEAGDGSVDGLLARVKPGADIRQTNGIPYSIPEHWAWVKLSDLYEINPKVEAHPDTEAAFVPMERISAGFDDSFTFDNMPWSLASKNHTRFADGDVAFAKISPCFENRKSFIAQALPNGIGGGTTELIVLRQREMLPQYTHYLVLDQRLIKAGVASYSGTVGQQRVKPDVIRNYMVPVPPLPEQRRIVAKIDAIFSLLDTIDTLQSAYTANQKALRAKLIDVAIRGQLTEQFPEDGTAEELYAQIQAEKQALIAAGKIKREKPLTPVTEEEKPFEVPGNWMWVRLGDVYAINPRVDADDATTAAFVPMERISAGYDRTFSYEEQPWPIASKNHTRFCDGDVAFAKISPCFENRKSFIATNLPNGIGGGTTELIVLRQRLIDPLFTYYVIADERFIQHGISTYKGTVGQQRVKNEIMFSYPFPLPPLAEQRRIVARLEELLGVCGG